VQIHLSPLRERREDVPVLVRHFVDTLSKLAGLRAVEIDPALMARLQQHNWPGNVREVRNTMERVLIFSQGRRPSVALLEELLGEGPWGGGGPTLDDAAPADADHDAETGAPGADDAQSLRTAVESFERQHILARLRAHSGQVAATARELGLERSHLYKKMRALGIDPDAAR